MSSIIEGYNYDIFISYRQKDNKGDRWVSEFVEALKTELESTFKEEISVYFDINPHDGLLETHDVDESLKDKLKCLVFIPIISRTYCDPKSFAWEREFRAFVEQASHDKFGLKIKLSNGNVASRVLPIQIHDLKPEDKVLVEKELGGFLRPIEFIYRESGVNRPLKSDDDDKINLNKTKYRNQINKTANAIDEIINNLVNIQPPFINEKSQTGEQLAAVRKEEEPDSLDKTVKLSKRKLLSGVVILAVLIVSAIIVYPKIFKQDALEKLRLSGERISVAVMPFQNMTNDTTWNIWQNGIQNELITSLTNSEELKVRQTESINSLIQSKGLTNYASITPSVASTLSQKLNANVFIYGSIKQSGSTIRLNAQLVDSRTEEAYKSFQIDGTAENILHITDSLSGMVNNFLIISILKKEVSPAFYKFLGSTKSPDALRNFISGQKAFSRSDFPTAIKFYLRSIDADSNYFFPYIQIFWAYRNQDLADQPVNVLTEESNKWCLKIYEKKDLMSPPQKNLADWIYAVCFGSPYEAIKYLRQTLELDDQLPDVYSDIGTTYQLLHQYDKAIPEYEKALEIYNKWGVKPFWSKNYTRLGNAYHLTGQYKKERQLYKKAEQDFPDNPDIIDRQSILSFTEGDTVAGNRYLEKSVSIRKDNSESAADIATSIASVFSLAGILDKAEEYFRQALSFEPDNTLRMNNLAYFLIDNNRNINEGLELADKSLELSPDNVVSLDYKGWGLFKKGRYEEALQVLERGWNLRHRYSIYFHIDEIKKAIANQETN